MRMTRELRVPGKYDVKVGGRRLNSNGKPTHVPKPLTPERKALAEQWTGLVVWAVKKWYPDAKWHARDELKSIAALALVEAAERFDPAKPSPKTGRPVMFKTFAAEWIWGRLKTATAATGVPSVQFVLVPGGGRKPECQSNFLAGPDGDVLEAVAGDARRERRRAVLLALRKLSLPERRAVRASFGLSRRFGQRGMRRMGKQLRIGLERMRRIRNEGIAKLRAELGGVGQ